MITRNQPRTCGVNIASYGLAEFRTSERSQAVLDTLSRG